MVVVVHAVNSSDRVNQGTCFTGGASTHGTRASRRGIDMAAYANTLRGPFPFSAS